MLARLLLTAKMLRPGGQVASAMVTCAKLGLRVKYVGSIGDDERGRVQIEACGAQHQPG